MAHSKEKIDQKKIPMRKIRRQTYQKDFKTIVLKIIKELKNDIDKFKN